MTLALSCGHPGMRKLRGPSSAATFGQQIWAGGWTQGQAEVPHATNLGIGAGVRCKVAGWCKESASDASVQTPCRTTYCSWTLPNALLIKFFFYI